MASLSLFQTLDIWKEKCSICFEKRCDFCLPGCEDQFCIPCMKRYLQEVVDNSWGLSGCQIKCPVCHDPLSKSVWIRYADKKTIQKYETFNRPYRLFSRFCSQCGNEVSVSQPPPLKSADQKSLLDEISTLIRRLSRGEELWANQLFEEIAKAHGSRKKNISHLYCNISSKILAFVSRKTLSLSKSAALSPAKRRELEGLAVKILSKVISLEADPEKWRELQYQHVKLTPKLICERCASEMCFRCGEASWHEGHSCQSYLTSHLDAFNAEHSETIQWALINGKRCPKCSVLIHREDGCNKVDCLYCGHTFCWICEGEWSTTCGFYRCGNQDEPRPPQLPDEQAENEEAAFQKTSDPSQPEIGVPDVSQIERKLLLRQERRQEGAAGGGLATPILTAISLLLVFLSLVFLAISMLNACLLVRIFDQEPPKPRDPAAASKPAS